MPGDRLTGLDASFLHLEDASAHMHVASVMVFEGDPPAYEELLESIERRLHLVPRYRQRLALRAAGPGPPALGRRPPPEPALPRARHRPARTRRRGPAARPGQPRVRAAAGPRQAAVGDLAGRGPRGRPLRAAVQDPPRAGGRRLRRGHLHRALRHLGRARRTARPGPALAARPRALGRAAAWRGAAGAGHHARRGGALRARAVPGAAAGRRGRRATPLTAWAPWPGRA